MARGRCECCPAECDCSRPARFEQSSGVRITPRTTDVTTPEVVCDGSEFQLSSVLDDWSDLLFRVTAETSDGGQVNVVNPSGADVDYDSGATVPNYVVPDGIHTVSTQGCSKIKSLEVFGILSDFSPVNGGGLEKLNLLDIVDMATIDLSGVPALKDFEYSSSGMTEEAAAQNLASLTSIDFSVTPDIERIQISSSQYGFDEGSIVSEIIWPTDPKLTHVGVAKSDLSTAEVDKALAALAAGSVSGGFVDLTGNAPPTDTTNVDVLLARGWTVNTD